MLLKALPRCCAEVLLFSAHGHPSVIAHPVENRRGWQKTVAVGNISHGLRRENTGSEISQFVVVESGGLCVRLGVKHLIFNWLNVFFVRPVVLVTPPGFLFAYTIRQWRIVATNISVLLCNKFGRQSAALAVCIRSYPLL